jgi:hypothetical protein|tara:strand:+ start:19326 stop:19565 length:240 start_codon:yes stop_codon:yes gene_type:complete
MINIAKNFLDRSIGMLYSFCITVTYKAFLMLYLSMLTCIFKHSYAVPDQRNIRQGAWPNWGASLFGWIVDLRLTAGLRL